ncbi:MAG: DNA replication and repair protein RecF [Verrucomicrobia bacterium]|nr:DNA replication and repair protein RecF [Verrucomicrobiota bacterium]
MQVTRVRLQNYRNISFVDLSLEGATQFFVGNNAQGKTNLLEAIGLIAALRSFRTSDSSTLIQQDSQEAKLVFNLSDEAFDSTEIWITLKKKGKEILVDGEKVARFRDYIGRYPAVILSSQDIQLLRGAPGIRRQWLNLVLASSSRSYYDALKDYHRLLLERNSLLKRQGSIREMQAFEVQLAEKAILLFKGRSEQIPRLEHHLRAAYSQISIEDESPEFTFSPDCEIDTQEAYLAMLAKYRGKDTIFKSTQHGPHRDDFELRLEGRTARDFGSEGQQRSLMIALKIAQLRFLEETSGRMPILLADDVLGELDPHRRKNFWATVGDSVQVIATGTEVPSVGSRGEWKVFDVAEGTFEARD